MTLVAVAPRYRVPGFDGRRTRVPNAFEVLDLRDALTRVYPTDAHLVTYVLGGARRQPRINKPGLASFDGFPEVGVFLCDLDNPDHAPWAPELHQAALGRYESLPILQTAGIYHTKNGARIVQPIVHPIPVEQVEPYIARWLSDLKEAGLDPDESCKDWTRLFRLPNVFRDGEPFRTPYMNLERMRPIALEPLWDPPPVRAALTPRAPRPVPHIDWRQDLPAEWREPVQAIAAAVRGVPSEWHTLFLALSGALLRRGVAPDLLPAIVRSISVATGADARTEDREGAARTTVDRYLAGLPCSGFSTLVNRWPDVADAVQFSVQFAERPQGASQSHEEAGGPVDAPDPRTALSADPGAPEGPLPIEQSRAALRAALRDAPDGLSLIAAECGLGKTAAAIEVAAERAARTHVSPDAEGKRAPAHSKTAISVDKHELALQIVADLAARGVQARRLFGPLSLKHADGTPVCQLHQVARHLVDGGQPMQWELCQGRDIEPCPFRDTCPARDGVEGPEDARVTVGPHQLVGALDREAGTTGLLVIDEPPDLLDLVPLRPSDLRTTLDLLPAFDASFASALAPALEALLAWAEHLGPAGECVSVREAITLAAGLIDSATLDYARAACQFDGDAIEYAAAAQPGERTGKAPPIRFMNLRMARDNEAYARKLGQASGVLRTVYHAVTTQAHAAVVVEPDRKGRPVLVVLTVREQLAQALRREGAVVAMDANVTVNAPIFAKAVGYDPPIQRFAGADGAPVHRLHIQRRSAVRKYWLPHGKLTLAPGLVQSVKDIVEFAEGTASLGIITMRTIELALAAALAPEDSGIDAAWHAEHQDPAVLAQARDTLGPILLAYPGRIVLGHYGAVRGLNHMADLDCLATLGDPWPPLNRVRHEVMFLGLDEAWEHRMVQLCQAELEQAHGRLRTIHRTRPVRAVHVGSVRPTGHGWTTGPVEVQRVKLGRPPSPTAMSTEEVAEVLAAVGGVRAFARVSGVSRATIGRLMKGGTISQEIAAKIREVRSQYAAPVGGAHECKSKSILS